MPRNLTISQTGSGPNSTNPFVPAPADADISAAVFNSLAGNVTLTATNDIDTTNNTATTIGTAAQTSVTLTALQNVSIGGPIRLTAGPLNLTATNGSIQLGNTISVGGNTLNLNAGTTITQSGGGITAGTLTGSAMGSTSLTSSGNAIATLGSFMVGGDFSLNDSVALTLASSIDTSGHALALTALTLSGSASITTGSATLTTTGAGASTLAGDISTSSGLTISDQGAFTASGQITGAGGLTKMGTGTLTLSTANTYSGGTSIKAGRLVEAGTGDALGSGDVSISSDAVLELNNTSADVVFQRGATFTGAGTIQKTGSGTVAFGYNGPSVNLSLSQGGLIDVEEGTLVGSTSDGGYFTGNKAGLFIAEGAEFAGVEGAIIVDGLNGAGTLSGGFQGRGSTTIGVADGDGSFSGTIQDSDASTRSILSLTKMGAGTQTLSGSNTYTGGTSLNGGTLELGRLTSAGTGNITFGAGVQILRLDTAGTLDNQIDDLGAGDAIDLQTIARIGATLNTATSGNVTTLTVFDGTDTNILTVENAANGFRYALGSDADSATIILEEVPPAPPNPPTPAGPTPGPDNLTGTEAADTVSLLAGNDTYSGLGGNDLIYGNQGNDTLYGNEGNDTVYGGQNNDRLIGGQDSDRLYGNLGNDRLYGNNGNDRLYGGQGNDYLVGGDGADILVGGLGNDILIGGAGADRYVFTPDPGAVDLIRGFSTAEGDRLDLGGQDYTERYAGDGDAILTLSGGSQVRLDGVTQQEFGNGAGYFVG